MYKENQKIENKKNKKKNKKCGAQLTVDYIRNKQLSK